MTGGKKNTMDGKEVQRTTFTCNDCKAELSRIVEYNLQCTHQICPLCLESKKAIDEETQIITCPVCSVKTGPEIYNKDIYQCQEEGLTKK